MLLACISESMIDKDQGRGKLAMEVLKRYFSDGRPLARELSLQKTIQENRGVDEKLARRILSEVLNEASQLDWRVLDIKKSNLIKEINYTLGRDFFDRYRIPEYRAIASTYMLMTMQSGKRDLKENIDRVKLEESVIQYMVAAPKAKPERTSTDRNMLALKLAVEAFNEQYGKTLSEGQREVVDAFVVGSVKGDYTRFRRVVEGRRTEIIEGIEQYMRSKEATADKVLHERLGTAVSSLKDLDMKDPSSCMEDIMLFQGVLDEIRK